jgi:hypothetical protein
LIGGGEGVRGAVRWPSYGVEVEVEMEMAVGCEVVK